SNAEVNALLHFDGGTTADPVLYKAIGPNNEVYVLPNSALAFQFVSDVEPAGVYLELQAPYGNDVSAYLYSRAAGQPANPSEMIGTASGMYYSITDKLNWSYDNADGKYHSGAFIVYNGTTGANGSALSNPIDYILAIANVKFTYNEASRGTRFAGISSVEYTRVINSLEKLEWKIYSPLFDLDVHTAAASTNSSNGSGISRFGEAYMTIVTSTDVNGLIVKDAAGNLVKIKACSFSDNGDVRTWTITIDRNSTKSYNVYVTTVSAIFDMRNPVSRKVNVPALATGITPGSGLKPGMKPVA
ncbi:MAG: hypothetical protein J6P98_00625, partial [Clostridia bacterium]|nr:hypothetical protein [Clostridia bacterium]